MRRDRCLVAVLLLILFGSSSRTFAQTDGCTCWGTFTWATQEFEDIPNATRRTACTFLRNKQWQDFDAVARGTCLSLGSFGGYCAATQTQESCFEEEPGSWYSLSRFTFGCLQCPLVL